MFGQAARRILKSSSSSQVRVFSSSLLLSSPTRPSSSSLLGALSTSTPRKEWQETKRGFRAGASVFYPPKNEDEPDDLEEMVGNILYNTNEPLEKPVRHVLHALVTNEPGVLSKVSGVLAARGFNIDSLVVCQTEAPALSRMTLVLKGADTNVEQARRQLEDMVPVWAVLDFSKTDIIERELLLLKVSTVGPKEGEGESKREREREKGGGGGGGIIEIQSLTTIYGGKILDASRNQCTIELCADPQRVDAFLLLMKHFGIIESSRSGTMAMGKTPMEGGRKEEKIIVNEIDATQLPPG